MALIVSPSRVCTTVVALSGKMTRAKVQLSLRPPLSSKLLLLLLDLDTSKEEGALSSSLLDLALLALLLCLSDAAAEEDLSLDFDLTTRSLVMIRVSS